MRRLICRTTARSRFRAVEVASVKPVDLQAVLTKSQETARLQMRDRLAAAGEQAVHDFRKDLEKKSATVSEPRRADTTRIEDKSAGGGGRPGRRGKPRREPGHDGAHDADAAHDSDRKKGQIIDIEAGSARC
jgi:hypothetical protein